MRALVISGGGSKGAYAGGFAKYLIQDLKREYDILVGSSTGSLIVPFLADGLVDEVQRIYTTVTQKDIYNVCPFIIKKNPDGSICSSINHFNTLRMFLKGKKTFGEHKALLKTIKKNFKPEHFEKIKASDKKVVVTVSNFTTNNVEYKHVDDFEYDEYCEWMWASASFVPFMSLYEKNGFEYADGGFGNYIPAEEALNLGATEVDVIVLQPRHSNELNNPTDNAFHLLLKSMQFVHYHLGQHDLQLSHMESIYNENVKMNFHFLPDPLTRYSFYFDPEQMKGWWDRGYNDAKAQYPIV